MPHRRGRGKNSISVSISSEFSRRLSDYRQDALTMNGSHPNPEPPDERSPLPLLSPAVSAFPFSSSPTGLGSPRLSAAASAGLPPPEDRNRPRVPSSSRRRSLRWKLGSKLPASCCWPKRETTGRGSAPRSWQILSQVRKCTTRGSRRCAISMECGNCGRRTGTLAAFRG